MNTQDSQVIVLRVYEALDALIERKVLRGVQTFTNKYDINRRNFLRCRANPASDIFQPSWMMFLVRDFNVSPTWLLTGNGDMFSYKTD